MSVDVLRRLEPFGQDIGGWAVDSVTDMTEFIFDGASSFNQDLGWCVDDVNLAYADETPARLLRFDQPPGACGDDDVDLATRATDACADDAAPTRLRRRARRRPRRLTEVLAPSRRR